MKIVLYFKKLNIGGAERSTIRLLNEFVKRGHEVTLFMETKGGVLESELDTQVKQLFFYENRGELKNWNHKISSIYKIGFKNIVSSCRQYLQGEVKKIYYRLKKPAFDLAITGWHGYNPYFLKRYTTYKVHIQMIRNENAIVNIRSQVDISQFSRNLNIVDYYVCVSNYVRNLMIHEANIPPDRVHTIYNVISIPTGYTTVGNKPQEYVRCNSNDIIVVTVCRLVDKVKGLYRMADICKELAREFQFKWFVIGDGPDREKFQKYIDNLGLNSTMILCGFQKNPIPYYMHADLVAVLSYVEGLCGAVNEAKLLEKPLIATKFSGIDEQITHGVNGYIVENDMEDIVAGMKYLFSHREFMNSLAVNGLSERLTNNAYKIKEFETLYHYKLH